MISVHNISKTFQGRKILDNVSFEVKKGELFGLIGPEGAGKSTLFRILATLLIPDSGKARVGGYDISRQDKKVQKVTGYMPGHFSLYTDLTVEENLTFFAIAYDTSIEESFDLIKEIYEHLEPFKDIKAGQLSEGMKQKLALCCALIHRPEVLLLDEPTTGVDPQSRDELWQMFQRLNQHNITIIVSTSYMDEANLCHNIALLKDGKILETSKPETVQQHFPVNSWAVQGETNQFNLVNDLLEFPDVRMVQTYGSEVHYTDRTHEDVRPKLGKYLGQKGYHHIEIRPIQSGNDDELLEFLENQAS